MHVHCQSIFHPWFKEWFLANQGRLSPSLLYLTATYYNFQQPIWKVKVSPDALWNHLWIWLLSAHDGIVVCWVSLFAGFPCSTIVDNLLVLLLEKNQLQWWFERWRLYIMKKRSFHSTIAANGVLSDFPNVKAIRREERNCLKHLIKGKAAFASLPTGFGKCLIF